MANEMCQKVIYNLTDPKNFPSTKKLGACQLQWLQKGFYANQGKLRKKCHVP